MIGPGSISHHVLQAVVQPLSLAGVGGERGGDGLQRFALELAHQTDGVGGEAVTLPAIPQQGAQQREVLDELRFCIDIWGYGSWRVRWHLVGRSRPLPASKFCGLARFRHFGMRTQHLGPTVLLERLVEHLRHFKLPPLVLINAALADIITQSLSALCAACGEMGVTLALEVPRNLYVQVDATYFAKSMHCLVKHALENAPSGSNLTVRATPENAAAQASVSIEVVDSGPPLKESSPEAIFGVWNFLKPESQAARRVFAHRLLRNLGSTLAYEYTGGGNVFRFSLPLARVED